MIKRSDNSPLSLTSSLRRGIVIPSIIILLVVLIVIFSGSFLIKDEIYQQQLSTVNAINREADLYFNDVETLIKFISEAVQEYSSEEQKEFLKKIRTNYPRFSSLYLLNSDGIVTVDDSEFESIKGLDYSRESFYLQTSSNKNIYISSPSISLSTGNISIVTAFPILKNDNLNGIVVGELNLTLLQKTIEKIVIEKDNVVFIVDPSNTVIVHPDYTMVQERWNLSNHPLLNKKTNSIASILSYFKSEEFYLGSIVEMKYGWKVITEQRTIDAVRSIITLIVISVGAFIICLITIYFSQFRILKSVTTSINGFVNSADIISKGGLTEGFIDTNREYSEILSLEKSISLMVKSIREHEMFLENRVDDRTKELNLEIENRLKIEDDLQEAIQTQQVLFREVNHRVKNNLTSIISMINKEYDRSETSGLTVLLPVLNDLKNRIGGLSRVHSLLSESGWRPLFLSELCTQTILGSLNGVDLEQDVNLTISDTDTRINSDYAHNIALIINEMVTNTIKYGLNISEQTRISVLIVDDKNSINIKYKDNGPGFSNEVLDGNIGDSHIGIGLITGIIKRSLKGSVSYYNDNGAVTEINFENILDEVITNE